MSCILTPRGSNYSQWKNGKYYNDHLERVAIAESLVDTKPPALYTHLYYKAKPLQNMMDRYAEISRQNTLLLHNIQSITRSRSNLSNTSCLVQKSLNTSKRQRELVTISRENQIFMNRLLGKTAVVSNEDFRRDWERNRSFIQNISKYDHRWWSVNKSQDQSESPRQSSSRFPSVKSSPR